MSTRPGLDDIVQVIHGDAFVEVPKLAGTFDLVFLDAWKPDYKKFFDQVFPRVAPGGLFLAHNVINKKSEMGDFLRDHRNPSTGHHEHRVTRARRHVDDLPEALTCARFT